jgi:hypothetical protein
MEYLHSFEADRALRQTQTACFPFWRSDCFGCLLMPPVGRAGFAFGRSLRVAILRVSMSKESVRANNKKQVYNSMSASAPCHAAKAREVNVGT